MLPDDLKFSERVLSLRCNTLATSVTHGRMLLCDVEQRFYASCRYEAAVACRDTSEIIRRAAMLERFAAGYPVRYDAAELIVGSQRFTCPDMRKYYTDEQLKNLQINGNLGHIVVDYGMLLRYGIDGTAERIGRMADSVNHEAMARALEAFRMFVSRHETPICRNISGRAPQTFHEALQMLWFIQIFLHAEGNSAAVSFGRFDQYMWPFLRHDLECKSLDWQGAFELLGYFFLKCCEGDESQNLVVGGEENPLSLLLLRTMAELRMWQPSLSVRISSQTSDEFWREALNLCATGIGMPSFFNDPVVTASLQALDVPPERASDWGIVGCYEAAPQGDSYPMTVAAGVALPQWFDRFLKVAATYDSFDEFYPSFKTFIGDIYLRECLPEFQRSWNWTRQNHLSPFESVCVGGCIESGLAAEEGGARFNLFGVNIMGIGTLVDSLMAIKKLVYERKEISLESLIQQLNGNFPDEIMLHHCRTLPEKFGSDEVESNVLAKDIATFIARLVLEHPLADGVRPYPGFFWFGRDIQQLLPATPDGRRDHDYISYGCGPGIFLSPGNPTSLLNSVAQLPHDLCACGNPLTLALNREDVKNPCGLDALRRLIEGYFSQGGFHLHINLAGVDELRAAQHNPEHHRDLIVRISGFSTAFVTLDERWQNAIIERTEKGR